VDYSIFDHMIEGVQLVDREFRYVYVNEAVARHGRSTRERLLGTTMSESYPGIETTEIYRLLGECMREGRQHQLITEFTFPDGSTGYFQLRMQPVPDGVLILSFDITDQKRAELAVRDMNLILEQEVTRRTEELRARNEELEQIAYIAAHDLQEPLRTIRSHVDIVVEDAGDRLDGEARTSLEFVTEAADRMRALVTALLDFSRLGRTGEVEPVALSDVLRGALADLERAVRESRAAIEHGELPAVSGYPDELRLLFQNLLSNALKFRKPDAPPRIAISATQEPDRWVISVRDEGIGFDPKYRDRIFNIFQRLHGRRAYEGTGIGLAHCKKIVALHGGQIWCDSVPGEGSTFSFSLPRGREEAA